MHNDNWGYGMDGGGWWIAMALMMAVFWGGLIWLGVTLLHRSNHPTQPPTPTTPSRARRPGRHSMVVSHAARSRSTTTASGPRRSRERPSPGAPETAPGEHSDGLHGFSTPSAHARGIVCGTGAGQHTPRDTTTRNHPCRSGHDGNYSLPEEARSFSQPAARQGVPRRQPPRSVVQSSVRRTLRWNSATRNGAQPAPPP